MLIEINAHFAAILEIYCLAEGYASWRLWSLSIQNIVHHTEQRAGWRGWYAGRIWPKQNFIIELET